MSKIMRRGLRRGFVSMSAAAALVMLLPMVYGRSRAGAVGHCAMQHKDFRPHPIGDRFHG
jgi:hypothetical protein